MAIAQGYETDLIAADQQAKAYAFPLPPEKSKNHLFPSKQQGWLFETEVRISQIEAAGNGRYALETIEKGQPVVRKMIVPISTLDRLEDVPNHACVGFRNGADCEKYVKLAMQGGYSRKQIHTLFSHFTYAFDQEYACQNHCTWSVNHADEKSTGPFTLNLAYKREEADGKIYHTHYATKRIEKGEEFWMDYRRFQYPQAYLDYAIENGYPTVRAATLDAVYGTSDIPCVINNANSILAGGIVENVVIGDEKNQKDYYDKASHYDTVWGQDNIHFGYYPHLVGPNGGDLCCVLDNKQASDVLTKRMIDISRMSHKSKVLDLGCGKGQSVRLFAEQTGCHGVGIDISTTNIVRANQAAKELPHLNIQFYEGTFTELPKEVLAQKFDIIFSQVAFCHVHRELPHILEEAKKVLAPNGVMIINDYLGCDHPQGASQRTKDNVWKRLHFEYLHGHIAWRNIVEAAGLDILHYENLDRHMLQTYQDMEKAARQVGFKSADGALLADNYKESAAAIQDGEIGMNVTLLKVRNHRSRL